ncbi:TPA: MogA/MoaB family molybdenum cofactor biosynthesis protein [Candidatus Bipolaricaulota bacterium]|nr:MogA/MoaB family molybdenum cofactor biosynthesis protein [Candidatus Bipolaricaulota bacterium]
MAIHERRELAGVRCWVVTVSDTRSEDTDESGKLIRDKLAAAGHPVVGYRLVKDELAQIRAVLEEIEADQVTQVVILTGGTGISPRDVTCEALSPFLTKELPGFGELFRYLSYQEVGAFAVLSRALAGLMGGKLVFALPGSTAAVALAMDKLILPVLGHAAYELERRP